MHILCITLLDLDISVKKFASLVKCGDCYTSCSTKCGLFWKGILCSNQNRCN